MTGRSILRLAQRNGAFVALIAVCIAGVARYEAFLTIENLVNVLRQNSMLGLLALGMTFVILAGGIDLSVGAVLALSGVVTAMLSSHGTPLAIVGGVAVGATMGAINGLLIAKARIQPFIVTLATLIAVRGVALAISAEQSISVDAQATGLSWLGRSEIGILPVPVAVLFVAYVLGWAALLYTRFGRYVYAVGDSDDAARLMGLHTDRIVVAAYALSGSLAGLAGVVLTARLGAGQPVAGIGWELDAIAAVVLGGTVLTGGKGGVGSTLVGVLLLGVIFNLLNLEGTISPWWQWILRGVFLLTVVVVQNRLQHSEVSLLETAH